MRRWACRRSSGLPSRTTSAVSSRFSPPTTRAGSPGTPSESTAALSSNGIAGNVREYEESLSESDLLHEIRIAPEQPLVIHSAVHPMADRRHADRETLARRRDRPAVGSGHRASEGSRHHARYGRPRARTEADRMHFNLNVGGEDEERFEVL